MDSCRNDCVKLAHRTWPAVEAELDAGVDGVILPLGATEQHGPHLPLDTDTRLAAALGQRIARRLGDMLVAPAIPVGPSGEHAPFSGTLSVTPATLQRLVEDAVASFDRQGFERVVILPGHGGSFPIVDAFYPKIARTAAVDVVAITGLRRYMDLLGEGLRKAGVKVDEPVGHAGASETAMMLTVAPDDVGEERPEGHTGPVSAAALFSQGLDTYAENGVLGDARPATAEVGETILTHLVDAHTAYIRDEFEALANQR